MNSLELENEKLEREMVKNSYERMKDQLNESNEHSLHFSMEIKRIFEKVGNLISGAVKFDGKRYIEVPIEERVRLIPFDYYHQHACYTISSHIILAVFEQVPLRDFLRNLYGELDWKVEFSEEQKDQYRKDVLDEFSHEHSMMFNTIAKIIDTDENIEKCMKGNLFKEFNGVVGEDIILELSKFSFCVFQSEDKEILDVGNALASYIKIVEMSYKTFPINISQEKMFRKKNTARSTIERRNGSLMMMYKALTEDSHESHAMEWFSKLICDIINYTSIVVVDTSSQGTAPTITGTKECKEKYERIINEISNLRPMAKPMIVPPRPWVVGSNTGGGYRTIDCELVPALHPNQKLPESLYINSVNKIQNTAFCINRDFMAAVKEMEYTTPIPKRRFVTWLKERFRRFVESTTSKNRDRERIIEIAEEYEKYSKFWFTCYADFRGRVYFKQQYLNPQGQDLAKACLLFSEGKKIDKDGLKWLRIHIANLAGFDKKSYVERSKWVRRNTDMIVDIADNPAKHKKYIMKADKPFQFLAACIEYRNYLNDPDNFVSRLPVAMDGVCNGTQHWCAMLRDKVGGELVALLNSSVPSDLYTKVLEKLKSIVSSHGTDKSKAWENSGAMTRKLVKTPTMTITYAAGKPAFMGHVRNYCIDNGYSFSDDKVEQNRYVDYMVDNIIEAIDSTVSARSGMKFVQDCVDGKLSVEWPTPIGFYPYMQPMRYFKREFKVMVNGRVRMVTFSFKSDKVDKMSIGTGIAPNFVHSMDATHMLLTVNSLPEINSWMMVHDSYATLATDVKKMQKAIREQFVSLYKEDRLKEFALYQGLKEGEFELPKYGDLDINDIKKSKYFFS